MISGDKRPVQCDKADFWATGTEVDGEAEFSSTAHVGSGPPVIVPMSDHGREAGHLFGERSSRTQQARQGPGLEAEASGQLPCHTVGLRIDLRRATRLA